MKIGIWGDSITYGESDSEGLGWVGRLRKSFPSEDYVGVYNRGVCGDTSDALLKRFSVEADSIKPNKILFAIGINDSKYASGETINRVPIENFKKNMSLLVQQAKAYTENIYIVSATKVDEVARPSVPRFVNKDIQIYNDFLKELSQNENLIFVNVFDILDPAKDLYDGLHPNASGYEKLYSVIAAKIR